MQVTSGSAKGHRLHVPAVSELRPTKSIVRQALFSIIGDIKGIKVLDLFAGSGSLGIEALSRGAEWVDFVDINLSACEAIRSNLQHARLQSKSKVYRQNAEFFIQQIPPNKYDLVLLDPPYQYNLAPILNQIPRLIKNEGVVIYLHHKDRVLPAIKELSYRETRHYGETAVSILTKFGI